MCSDTKVKYLTHYFLLGKKNKGSKQLGNNQQLMQNQIPQNPQQLLVPKQEMSERNLVRVIE